MPQIGFTSKQAHVYTRFNALRRAYEDANGGGRVYNPDFLSVLMDAWEERQKEGFVIRHKENHSYFVLDKRYAANPDAKFTFKQSEALVFDTEFEAEDFGFVNSHWLQEFEVAPLKPETE